MSATVTAARTDRGAAADLMAYLNRRADNPAARAWDSVMRDALNLPAAGTVRAWMNAHNGDTVRTLQATVHTSGDVYSVWTPGPRTVTATRAGSVQLDGSTRDYAGLRVAAATPDTLIAVTTWGDDARQVCVYTTRAD